jgi:hypothetical protein
MITRRSEAKPQSGEGWELERDVQTGTFNGTGKVKEIWLYDYR